MSSRRPPRSPSQGRPSSYKMTRAATMRRQENIRRYSGNQTQEQNHSRIRGSRMSVVPSRYSMRSSAGSRRSIASVAKVNDGRKPARLGNSTGTGSSSRAHDSRQRRKRKLSEPKISSVLDQESTPDINLDLPERNEEFMASNYTCSAFSSDEVLQPKIIDVTDILDKPAPSSGDLPEESGWKIMDYIRSVKNSIFKESENVETDEGRRPDVLKKTTTATPNQDEKNLQPSTNEIKTIIENKTAERNLIIEEQCSSKHENMSEKPANRVQRLTKQSIQDTERPNKKLQPKTKSIETLNFSTGSVGPIASVLKSGSDTSVDLGGNSPGPKSALKSRKYQLNTDQCGLSPDKSLRRVSILASLGSLENMATSLTRLEREKTLEAIRRLEELAKEKRRQLALTRLKMRESLEEEIKINKKLESILHRIRMVRRAGEEAALIFDKGTQVFSSRRP